MLNSNKYLLYFFLSGVLYSNISSASDLFWETLYIKRPEIIIKSEYIDFANSTFFTQGFLYSFTPSNTIRMCLCAEYKYLHHSTVAQEDNTFAFRTRLNYTKTPQTQFFLDLKASLESNISMYIGFSHSRGLCYSRVIFEGHYNDLENPEIWIHDFKSIGSNLLISVSLTDKTYLVGYFAQKKYQTDSPQATKNSIDNITIEPSIDIYLFGKPKMISGKYFDTYETLYPRTYNRALMLSLGNTFSNYSDKKTKTQILRAILSLPIHNSYGFFGSASMGKNFFSHTKDASSHWGIKAGAYMFFSQLLGLFMVCDMYKPSGIPFQQANKQYRISCNYNL